MIHTTLVSLDDHLIEQQGDKKRNGEYFTQIVDSRHILFKTLETNVFLDIRFLS